MSRPIRSVCVFCGARNGGRSRYTETAQALGAMLASENWRLVYGAGDVGLMGEVARAAQHAGAETFGVVPLHLLGREQGRRDLTTLVVTETMHERKKVMFMNADAIVTLPGGPGTLDELFEVTTWRQLGLHEKPVLLLNLNGYWDPLLDLLDRIVGCGFADPSFRDFITVCTSVEEVFDRLEKTFA